MANPYLQVDGLTKSFGDLVLFENISFGVAEGQRIGLIAKNGSGKTTLLSILSGKEGYDEGSIVYRRDLRVGYLEQDPHYPEELTVLEACFYHGTPVVQLIKEYEKCMETEGNPGLEDLLARMEQEKAWDYIELKRALREKAMAPHSNTIAWKTPRMEEPGRLQSMGLLRVGYD